MQLYSRAQLAAMAGVADDVATFWIRQNLLLSAETGERKHRRFTLREVKLARLLREVRGYGMNVGAMRDLLDRLRNALALLDDLPPCCDVAEAVTHAQWLSMSVDDAQAAEMDRLEPGWREDGPAAAVETGHITEEQAEGIRAAAAAIPRGRAGEVWLALNFTDAEGVLSIYLDGCGAVQISDGIGDDTRQFPAASALVVSLERLFADFAK